MYNLYEYLSRDTIIFDAVIGIVSALKQIISSKAENTGVGRLLHLYNPSSAATWVCSSGSSGGGDGDDDIRDRHRKKSIAIADSPSSRTNFVVLRFSVKDSRESGTERALGEGEGGEEGSDVMEVEEEGVFMNSKDDGVEEAVGEGVGCMKWSQHTFQELLDFQSNIVLDRSLSDDDRVSAVGRVEGVQGVGAVSEGVVEGMLNAGEEVVDKFLMQFRFAILGNSYTCLHYISMICYAV